MAARPRIRRRANWPANLHEPRPGYYTWRDPRDGKTHILGRVPLAQAIHEAMEANVIAEKGKLTRSLADRVAMGSETISDLIAKMPTEGLRPSTLAGLRGYDSQIRAAIGHIECAALTTKDVAGVIESIKSRGKARMAQAVRSRIGAICRRGIALGWMTSNPADVTERIKIKVKRRRLTLDEFVAILKKAPEVASWLENAMLLAIVTGQDRSTIAKWERAKLKGDILESHRSKTGVSIAIPLDIRLDALGITLRDVVAKCRNTGVVSKYLIHHVRSWGQAKRGDPVRLQSFSHAFAEARKLAGITGDDAPTFHEIRSLAKRLYDQQGNVDTKALLGHTTDAMAALYANNRGLEPIKVRIGA